MKKLVKQLRINLAYKILPKQIKKGDWFTVVKWNERNDKSWIGDFCLCTAIIGDIIVWDVYGYREYPNPTMSLQKDYCGTNISHSLTEITVKLIPKPPQFPRG